MVTEQESEIASLRDEIDQSKLDALNQLSMDDQTRKIIQDLKDDNQRYSDMNVELKHNVSALQKTISSMKSEVEQFKFTITQNLRREIRPNVVLLEKECKVMKEKYESLESEFRQVIRCIFIYFLYNQVFICIL